MFPGRNRSSGRYYAIDFDFNEIKLLKASERFDYKNSTKPVYPLRFPLNKASFQLNSLEEEIQLVQGLTKSLNSIYELEPDNIYTKDKRFNTGIYVEIKDPSFHKENNKPNFSEIVLSLLEKYGYKNKNDNVIIQCFDVEELKRIREELKSNLTLVQLLYPENLAPYFERWNTLQGLTEISKFADGIGPEINQLVDWNENNKVVKGSEFYKNAKQLGLFMHPYTFRIDSLPPYVKNFVELLDLFVNKLQVDGFFTDFPDLAVRFIESKRKNNSNKNSNISLFNLVLLNILFLYSYL
jgi:glycerophosphoryl diester phosphodiesterase